jgi:hypothetical protein
MSWDCPHYTDKLCQLNGLDCKPGKGKCVLKGRFEITSSKKPLKSDRNTNPHQK